MMIGAVLRIYLTLKSHHVAKTLTPRFTRQRNVELYLLKTSHQGINIQANIMLVVGFVLVLLTAVFN